MSTHLGELTTLGVGGDARRIDFASSRDSLIELAQDGLVLGRGSNVLVSDDGYDGNVVINRFEHISRTAATVTVSSGTSLARLCGYLTENGLSGLEWACGIPGSVGGAVRMNAGAFDGAISDGFVSAEILRDGKTVELGAEQMGFAYRESGLKKTDVVISATFAVQNAERRAISEKCAYYSAVRRAKQPCGRSAGSVFKNPRGVSVGKLLDDAGLKGLRRGGAVISPQHANIIVNTGGATAKDVVALIAVMRGAIERAGYAATEEIIYIGEF